MFKKLGIFSKQDGPPDLDEVLKDLGKKIDNQYLISESTTIQQIKVYKPDVKKNTLKNGWQGRLCWNIPFICSYNSLDVKEKNGYLIINKLSN